MKKQIFALVLVAFGTVMTVSAQPWTSAAPGSAPRGINCVDGPLTPIAGKSYTYQAASNQLTGANAGFTFWATKNTNFITTDASGVTTNNLASRLLTTAVAPATTPDLIATSGNYGTKSATDNVQITWSDALLSTLTATNPAFVAALNDGDCTNNFKAWAVVPIKAFTVDIRNMENTTTAPLAYGAAEDQCFDVVRGAVWNGTVMQYNFGTQVLYYEVVAANFTNSWTPTLTLSALGNGQSALIEWTYQNPAVTPWTAATVWNPATTVVNTTETSTTAGVSIYVRVTITNNTFEGLVPTPVTLTVDGVNSVGQWDIENNTLTDAGPLCNAGTLNDKMDAATQTLNPRPTVTPVAPTPFVNGNQTN